MLYSRIVLDLQKGWILLDELFAEGTTDHRHLFFVHGEDLLDHEPHELLYCNMRGVGQWRS